jgi:hypothetical protein
MADGVAESHEFRTPSLIINFFLMRPSKLAPIIDPKILIKNTAVNAREQIQADCRLNHMKAACRFIPKFLEVYDEASPIFNDYDAHYNSIITSSLCGRILERPHPPTNPTAFGRKRRNTPHAH